MNCTPSFLPPTPAPLSLLLERGAGYASVPFLKGKGCIPPTLFFIKKVRRDACGGEAGGYETNFFYYNKKKNDKHPKGEAPLIKIVDFYKHPYIEARLGDLVIRGWAA